MQEHKAKEIPEYDHLMEKNTGEMSTPIITFHAELRRYERIQRGYASNIIS